MSDQSETKYQQQLFSDVSHRAVEAAGRTTKDDKTTTTAAAVKEMDDNEKFIKDCEQLYEKALARVEYVFYLHYRQ